MQGIDLHTHSNISDGTLSPELLVQAAIDVNLHTLALTDHDTMDGLQRAKIAAQGYDLNIISEERCFIFQLIDSYTMPSTIS